MSLNPYGLKEGDRITFGGKISKTVHSVCHHLGNGGQNITFTDCTNLYSVDPLWELAELVKLKLPDLLYLAKLDDDGWYYGVHGIAVSPRALINLLRRDLATLEAAGIGKEEEE